MTDLPDNPRPRGLPEPALRDLYRELATETPAPELDAQILAAARNALNERRGPRQSWMRPLAVAATLGLCVALVLEVGTGPDGRPDVPETSLEKREEVGNAARESRAQKMGENKAGKSLPAAPVPSSFSDAVAAPAETMERPDPDAGDPFAYRPDDDLAPDGRALARRAGPGVSETEPVRQTAVPEASAIEELAVVATDERARAIPANGDRAPDGASSCDPHETREPGPWLECIEGLEAAGKPDLAASERRRRRAAFPDAE